MTLGASRPYAIASIGLSLLLTLPALGAERELDEDTPPSSAKEIRTPIQKVFPEEVERPPLIPWFREQLQKLPPFFADTVLDARFRTAYIRQDRTSGDLSYAWAMGGSVYYRSGWLADLLAVELEGFTSQPIYAPLDRDGTELLAPMQEGYSALGIANAKVQAAGLLLTGYRQYLDLPYLNRNDSRMTPNTFEALILEKPEGELKFTTGYTWRIKRRNSDEFVSMTEAIGLTVERGLAHWGAVWDPKDDFHIGAMGGYLHDVFGGLYAELGVTHESLEGFETRLDFQFTYEGEAGKELLGDGLADAWNLGVRGSTSWKGAVLRLGVSVTGEDAGVIAFYGSSPSYVELMQRGFDRPDEKALLVSLSYDFAGIGADGLSIIMNFVAGFDGVIPSDVSGEPDRRGDSQEIDVTLDYRIKKGFLESFWLRLRYSWLTDDLADSPGTDIRFILRYDFPVI